MKRYYFLTLLFYFMILSLHLNKIILLKCFYFPLPFSQFHLLDFAEKFCSFTSRLSLGIIFLRSLLWCTSLGPCISRGLLVIHHFFLSTSPSPFLRSLFPSIWCFESSFHSFLGWTIWMTCS